ncbi:uncharacterized protein MONOS_16378 [Monocercomonoides exilis]|uniref:uncharacterized protein n=1 Tax=Monocercomonoides exilis TaxID=2049356 RepID=UPI0035594009|nr:hypothetical protein MONOS_16378 [Monocercomonoides exilis]|eukprot:MONOS_16378.1-p1 / transcript=MONOS_16378.1 / gene=MONOS_16378 / organism=Monocercomonoides_exilis_PA203 / gene_product=unspecified product / transcript_product=unspecified product / location=Mono_scaffold01690:1953-2359(-) / protein_length=83 / sequence_SO=supercontig / SO=protein_coding / is_pseudo=false
MIIVFLSAYLAERYGISVQGKETEWMNDCEWIFFVEAKELQGMNEIATGQLKLYETKSHGFQFAEIFFFWRKRKGGITHRET